MVKKLQEGHPNLIDHLIDGRVQLIFNTPRGKGARTDEGRIRAASVLYGVPCITTLPAAEAVRAGDGGDAEHRCRCSRSRTAFRRQQPRSAKRRSA